MFEKFRKWVEKKDDDAVSPVIGTILMVAVTVVLGATVYAALNQFGGGNMKEPVNAAFRVQAVDTNGNGKTDSIRITYLSGPDVADEHVSIAVTNATSGNSMTNVTGFGHPTTWTSGNYTIYQADNKGTFFVTISVLGQNVLDQSVKVDETTP